MAFKLFDRVQEISTSTGTGDFTLGGAITGFQSFASRYSTGDTLYYGIHEVNWSGVPTGAWEIGLGTYSASNTLTRTTVMASSNSDAAVSFASGDKRVFVTMTALQGGSIREKLSSNRTYYVRTDGSDSNNGLANTSSGAFLTIQKAVNVIAGSLDLNGYDATVQVADGTYTGAVSMRQVVGFDSSGLARITINGNNSTPTNVVISTTSASCFTNSIGGTVLDVTNLKAQTTTSGSCLISLLSGKIRFSGMDFGATANFHISSDTQGNIVCTGNYTVSGGAQAHMTAAFGGFLQVVSRTVTISGSPTFTNFAQASQSAILYTYGSTYSGSVTGTRYSIATNATCFTNAGGANYFPGTVAGSTATGGQYA